MSPRRRTRTSPAFQYRYRLDCAPDESFRTICTSYLVSAIFYLVSLIFPPVQKKSCHHAKAYTRSGGMAMDSAQDFPHFSLLVWGNRLQTNDLLVLTSRQAGISIVLPKVQGNLAFGSTRHRAITSSAAHSIAYFLRVPHVWIFRHGKPRTSTSRRSRLNQFATLTRHRYSHILCQ
jgi:hypothetical protein